MNYIETIRGDSVLACRCFERGLMGHCSRNPTRGAREAPEVVPLNKAGGPLRLYSRSAQNRWPETRVFLQNFGLKGIS
jgi:hypothetical protein